MCVCVSARPYRCAKPFFSRDGDCGPVSSRSTLPLGRAESKSPGWGRRRLRLILERAGFASLPRRPTCPAIAPAGRWSLLSPAAKRDPIAKAGRPRSVPSPARAGTKSPPRDGDGFDYAAGSNLDAFVTLLFLQGVGKAGLFPATSGDRARSIPANHPTSVILGLGVAWRVQPAAARRQSFDPPRVQDEASSAEANEGEKQPPDLRLPGEGRGPDRTHEPPSSCPGA
jgi:hypothetical protein